MCVCVCVFSVCLLCVCVCVCVCVGGSEAGGSSVLGGVSSSEGPCQGAAGLFGSDKTCSLQSLV